MALAERGFAVKISLSTTAALAQIRNREREMVRGEERERERGRESIREERRGQ